jgi:Plasmid stabilization system protein
VELIWSEPAADNLEQIQNYIAEDNIDTAINFTKAIFDEVEKIPLQPYKGRKIPEISKDEYRELIFRKYRIMYKVTDVTIFVLAIIHSRVNFNSVKSMMLFKKIGNN